MKETAIRDFFFEALATYGLKHGKKELNIGGLRVDIFAIDKNHIPYIIEFKKDKDRHIVGQAAQYLTMLPTYKTEIEKKINLHDIRWDKLRALCIAPDFLERDLSAAKSGFLQGKMHFYTFQPAINGRGQVFALNLKYLGEEGESPLVIPEKIIDEFDIKQVREEYCKIEKKKARAEYYSQKILPLLKDIGNGFMESNDVGLFPHYSFWGDWFSLRVGTHRRKAHRASIGISFGDVIFFGFDLTHAFEEAKKLAFWFKDERLRGDFAKKTLEFKDYVIWIPNSGIKQHLLIDRVNEKGLDLLLQAYNPKKAKDCYFRVFKKYTQETLSVKQAVELLKEEYGKFQYIFDLLKDCIMPITE